MAQLSNLLHVIIQIMTVSFVLCKIKFTNIVNKPNHDENDRIVGGHPCPDDKFGFVVSIQNKYSERMHMCAGTLVTERWVMTASQCVSTKCSSFTSGVLRVIAGVRIAFGNYTPSLKYSQESGVDRCYFPVGYLDYNDIALLKLTTPMIKTFHVDFIRLPFNISTSRFTNVCKSAVVVGWGTQFAMYPDKTPMVTSLPEYDPLLQCVEISVISDAECIERFQSNKIFLATRFCAFRERKDTCIGDLGGPLLCNDYQYGITSRGKGCAHSPNPGLYTNVLYYKYFIGNVTSPFRLETCTTTKCIWDRSSLTKATVPEKFFIVAIVWFF